MRCQSAGVQRTLKFCDYLPEYGYSPVVLTGQPRLYENLDFGVELPDSLDGRVFRSFGFNAVKDFSLRGKYFRFMELPDRYASWYWLASRQGKRLVDRFAPELIWSTFPYPTAHRIAASLKQYSGLPWVADYRDPFGGLHRHHYSGEVPENRPGARIDQMTVEQADLLVFTTEPAAELYRKVYALGDDPRIVVIGNGYNEDAFEQVNEQLAAITPSPELDVLYSGELYGGRDPTHLFRALQRYQHDHGAARGIRLLFRGVSESEAIVHQQAAARMGLAERVQFLPTRGGLGMGLASRQCKRICGAVDIFELHEPEACQFKIRRPSLVGSLRLLGVGG